MVEETLRRYTSVKRMYDYLKTEQLLFSNPAYWEDQNDVDLIDLYKEKKPIKNVQALCFARSEETYLHWKAYGQDGEGVCIIFHDDDLQTLAEDKGIKVRNIIYKTIKKVECDTIHIADLPFIKRFPYQGEREIRYLFECDNTDSKRYSLRVPHCYVQKIVLGHNVCPTEITKIKNEITKLGISNIQTGITDTQTFQDAIRKNITLFPAPTSTTT